MALRFFPSSSLNVFLDSLTLGLLLGGNATLLVLWYKGNRLRRIEGDERRRRRSTLGKDREEAEEEEIDE